MGLAGAFFLLTVWLAPRAPGAPPGEDPEDWVFIDNGKLRLGVIKSAGAGIGYLSPSGTETNLLNHFDRGRLIQQSYYGDPDGSQWGETPWTLNPVQGGDYQGKIPPLVELRSGNQEIYSKSIPLHWATGETLSSFVMEQWISLEGELARVRFRMTYTGEESHAPRHQEIPAVFVDARLSVLHLYQGNQPWEGQLLTKVEPGPRNEYYDLPEHWAAFANESGVGLGVLVPAASQVTTYRFRGGGGSECSYLAPITTFAIQPGLTFEYEAWFAVGSVGEIRARFENLRKKGAASDGR